MASRRRGFGVRAWLVLVAAVALAMGAENFRTRRAYCLDRAAHHWTQMTWIGLDPEGLDREGRLVRVDPHATYHLCLARRFARAANRPWGAVPADPLAEIAIGAVCVRLGGFEPLPGVDFDR